jgi:hypothetical protein
MTVTRTSTLTYRFSGVDIPRRSGVRISVYRRSAGGPVLVASTVTTSNGSWVLSRRFTGRGTYAFYAVAAVTQWNSAGTSPARTVTLS